MVPEPKAPRTSTSIVPPFKLSTPLGTDIWRKPPTIDVFNAPTHPSPLPKYTLNTFHRARLTVSLPPNRYLRQFDQAGLILHLTSPTTQKTKWLKTGIEFYNSRPWISTAGCDNWSDWSVVPLLLEKGETEPKVTIEVERKGVSLWVYAITWGEGSSEERMPLREVNWVFVDEEWEVGVGGFVARETKGEGEDELVAGFEGGVLIEVLDA